MKRLKLIYTFILCLAVLPLNRAKAQYTIEAKQPNISELKTFGEARSANALQRTLVLDELRTDALRSANLNSKPSEFRVLRFAINRALEIDMQKVGEWFLDDEGHYVWAFSIKSPKALSTSVLFEDYELKEGEKLFVYGKGKGRGALTNINNTTSKLLQIAPLEGEQINFIYVANQGDKSKKLPFRITRLSHGFVDFRSMAAREAYNREAYNCDKGEPYYNLYNKTLAKLACADNVIKHEEQDLQARSVVLLITDGETMSSAALINNTRNDGTPYVLTASHCINGVFDYPNDLKRVKQSVASAVFFFGFESPAPNINIRGSEEKTISGAELIAYNTKADMALLKLKGLPKDKDGKAFIPPAYNPYFSGWNTSAKPKGPFFNIHHPVATTKRFNLSEDKELQIIDYSLQGLNFVQKHWRVSKWAIGTTDGGSSGSPLFDDNGLIIGALSGGTSHCSTPYDDKFFAIYKTWNGTDAKSSLKPWLDPDNSLAETCEGFDPNKEEKVYRLSSFYGKTEALQAYQGQANTLSHIIEIKEGNDMAVLGSYFVFKGNKDLQEKFPEHILELCPMTQDKVESAIWSSEITMPTYHYYSQDKSDFTTNGRTILADTVEVFLPKEGLKIKAGKYMLRLKRKEKNKPICIPLLKKGNDVWLDLLVKSAKPVVLGLKSGNLMDNFAYYSGGKLYVYLNEGVNLSIYDVEGKLCMKKDRLNLGQAILDLGALQRNRVYIAVLKSKGKKQILKFIHQ